MLQFSGGVVRVIPLPVDVTWTSDQCFRFASLVVMFEKQGFSQERASQLAESEILKEIHHGLVPKGLEGTT